MVLPYLHIRITFRTKGIQLNRFRSCCAAPNSYITFLVLNFSNCERSLTISFCLRFSQVASQARIDVHVIQQKLSDISFSWLSIAKSNGSNRVKWNKTVVTFKFSFPTTYRFLRSLLKYETFKFSFSSNFYWNKTVLIEWNGPDSENSHS